MRFQLSLLLQVYHPIKQFMRISILTVTIILITLQMLLAFTGKGQDIAVEKITLGLQQQSLEHAIRQIEQQTTLRFFYRKAEIRPFNHMNLQAGRRTVERTLYELLQNTSFSFRQMGQNILLESNDQVMVKRKIEGVVFTFDTEVPLRSASVELLRKSDLQLVGQGLTDSAGHFEVLTTDQSPHLIRVSMLGYHVYSSPIEDTESIILPAIYLKPDVKELKEVMIAVHSPLIKQEVDRLVYDVQADPEKESNSLLDILRKVPLVTVDADDNIKLKGNSSFKVLIDGHSSSLVVNDPKEIFRSMSASNIQRIEVITIPPAKYDSEGLVGILNIITVKKLTNGYSGNLGAFYKFPNGPRSNGSLNLKSGKFGLSAYAGLNKVNTPTTSFSNFRQSLLPDASAIDQQGYAHTHSTPGFISTQVTYEIDTLNLVSAVLNYNFIHSTRFGSVVTRQNDISEHSYRLDNDGKNDQHGTEAGIDYQHGFKRNKGQLLSFSYRLSANKNDQYNALTASEKVNYLISDYNQDNNAGVHEQTMQADYIHPLKHVDIEGGAKAIIRNNFSDFTTQRMDSLSNTLPSSPADKSHFSYQQNVYSIYNSYQFNLKLWTLKAGARLERTGNDYTNLIPSIAVQRKLTESASINLGYTERIQRPGISQLNPYVDQQNPNFITYGNPDLKPETNHILTVNYSLFKKVSVNAGLSYSFSNNTIQYVSQLGTDGITRGTYENLGGNKTAEVDINLNYPLSDRLNLSFNAQAGLVRLDGIVDGLSYRQQSAIGNGNIYLGYKFDNDWRMGLNGQYYSPAITLQSKSSPYYYGSLSLSKSIFNKKLNLSGSVSNPFSKYMDYKFNYTDPRFTQVSHNDIVYRRFNLGVNYRFGKLRDNAIKKNKKSVQNDDVKEIKSPIPGN